MRRFGASGALLVLLLCLLSWGAAAAPPRPVLAVDTVADLQAVDGHKSPLLQVIGFHAGSLQGGGLFVWQDTDRTPDGCTIFAAANGGRWMRRLEHGVLDVTMCGAPWDGVHDDAPAFNAAFTAASANGLSLSCPGGAGRIAGTVAPKQFANVILRCQGMEASKLSCAVVGGPCFLFQNPNGTAAIQAPQIYDLDVIAAPAPHGPTTVIQYNNAEGGFRDDATTQSYMMRPIVQRVQISGGAIAIQCSKCFDGDFSLNALSQQTRHGIDLEGTDWTSIGGAGPNRIQGTGGVPVWLVSRGTFGNGLRVIHNDILAPAAGTEAYIYSSARTSYLEANFLEGATGGACEIKIDMGAIHAVVRDNHVTDRTVKNWLCVVPQLRQADFSSNQTTTHGQGPARFENRGSWKDWLLGHPVTHAGNWSEAGFPSLWTLPGLF